MVNMRNMRLSDYNISRAKYNELKYFCMQYSEKLHEIQRNQGLKSVANDGQPRGNSVGHPVESTAIRNVTLQADLDLITNTIKEADAEIYPWLFKNITEGIPYEWMDVPKGRRQFYETRRYFFYLLAQKR